jgi:hypothetical protein
VREAGAVRRPGAVGRLGVAVYQVVAAQSLRGSQVSKGCISRFYRFRDNGSANARGTV